MGYLALLRLPFITRLLAGSLIGRLPGGMSILMIPLALRRSGMDYGFVGIASGALAVSAAVGGPVLGRLVDRVGQVTVLVPAAAASGLGTAANLRISFRRETGSLPSDYRRMHRSRPR
mgnify:CR=1 FL=1